MPRANQDFAMLVQGVSFLSGNVKLAARIHLEVLRLHRHGQVLWRTLHSPDEKC